MAKEAVLQVTTSFHATVGGEQMFFRAGDLVDADHPAVKKWPGYFGEPKVTHRVKSEPVVEQATAAPGQKRGR